MALKSSGTQVTINSRLTRNELLLVLQFLEHLLLFLVVGISHHIRRERRQSEDVLVRVSGTISSPELESDKFMTSASLGIGHRPQLDKFVCVLTLVLLSLDPVASIWPSGCHFTHQIAWSCACSRRAT